MRYGCFSVLALTTMLFIGCATPRTYVADIGNAHGEAIYDTKDAVQADFAVEFLDPAFKIKGTMVYTTDLAKARLDLDTGTTIVFDGDKAWITPANSAIKNMARFHVLTWPYFMALPFKADDTGTQITWLGEDVPAATSAPRRAYKLSFEPGQGDAPDDWYILFKDGQNRLDAAAYIVTYGKPKAQAENHPGIIVYRDFALVDGVTFATQWKFGHWSRLQGLTELKGFGELSNIRFVKPGPEVFARPAGSAEAPLP